MKTLRFVLATILILMVGFDQLTAQIPRTLSYQGVLTDAAGQPRPNPSYQFTFRLYDAATGGTALWTEQKTLPVTNGLFVTALGDQVAFGATVKFDRQYWLGIQVGSEPELVPRIALTSVGYSMSSLRADTARVAIAAIGDTIWMKSGADVYRRRGNVNIGENAPNESKFNIAGSSPQITIRDDAAEVNQKIGVHDSGLSLFYDRGQALTVNRATGNVGIGENAPNESKFNIAGSSPQITIRDDAAGVNQKIGVHDSGLSLFYDLGQALTVNRATGNVGIGTTNPSAKLEIIGRTKTQVLEITGGSDLAEPFEISENQPIPKGVLVIIDEENPGQLKLSHQAYNKRVAGIVSGAGGINPGLTLRQEGVMEAGQLVALTGKVYALATAANGPIKPGDLLTTSEVAGHAMKATDRELSHGAVIGKAMSRLEQGEGLVLVLVNLQ